MTLCCCYGAKFVEEQKSDDHEFLLGIGLHYLERNYGSLEAKTIDLEAAVGKVGLNCCFPHTV